MRMLCGHGSYSFLLLQLAPTGRLPAISSPVCLLLALDWLPTTSQPPTPNSPGPALQVGSPSDRICITTPLWSRGGHIGRPNLSSRTVDWMNSGASECKFAPVEHKTLSLGWMDLKLNSLARFLSVSRFIHRQLISRVQLSSLDTTRTNNNRLLDRRQFPPQQACYLAAPPVSSL